MPKDPVHINEMLKGFYDARTEDDLVLNRGKLIEFFKLLDQADRAKQLQEELLENEET